MPDEIAVMSEPDEVATIFNAFPIIGALCHYGGLYARLSFLYTTRRHRVIETDGNLVLGLFDFLGE